MRILLDNNVPRLLTSNLPDHQADTAFQRDWHTLTNGELLDQAESDGYQLLITADQRIPYQQNLSRRSIAVLIITSNERQAVSNAVAVINDAANSTKPAYYTSTRRTSATRTSTDDRSNTSVNCSYASSSWASNIAKKDQHQAQRRITSTQTRTMRKLCVRLIIWTYQPEVLQTP